MKTKNIVLSVAVTLAALSFALAEPTSKMVVMPSQKSEVFNVIYEGASAGKVVLEITDRNGNLLLSETTTGLSKFKRPINFTDMESGVYTITTKDAHGVIKQTVNYQTKSESVKTSSATAHISQLANGKYLLSVANKGTGKVSVTILDGNSNVLHTDSLTVTNYFSLVYNLKQVDGQPVFEVTDEAGNKVIK